MAEPWLTVVMPVHRGGDWLDEALASIPSPDDSGSIAVIIRDSTPEGPCEAPIERHRSRLPIDYEYLPDIASWTRKTNLGVEAARSKYACTLHQDDVWLPERVSVARAMVAAHPDAALYVTGASIIDQKGAVIGPWQPPFDSGAAATIATASWCRTPSRCHRRSGTARLIWPQAGSMRSSGTRPTGTFG